MGFWAAVEEVYPTTQSQRGWCHKPRNVLNTIPTSRQPKAKQPLPDIWGAETQARAEKAFEVFLHMEDLQYPKATACLQKDREALLTFEAFPAAPGPSLRTTNPIESPFGTIRHRTARPKVCLPWAAMLPMLFELGQCAEKTWRRRRGFREFAKVLEGIQLVDGLEETTRDSVAA